MVTATLRSELTRGDEGIYHTKYIPSGGFLIETANDPLREEYFHSYSLTISEEIRKEGSEIYDKSISFTGETGVWQITPREKIVKSIESAIHLIADVLEAYDDEIERLNTFSLFEEEIKLLWELREEANDNFSEALVLLEVAVKNSRYQNYTKNQFEAIKKVLEKISVVFVTPQKTKECRKILMDNGIDLYAPVRNWENFTVEIKKIDGSE